MSVENQLEEAAAVDVHVIKSDSLKESRLEEDEDDTQSQIAIANLTENTNDECFSIPNNAVNPGMKNGHDESKAESIRYWFGNLSNAERVAALGFNDESFLSSLIVHSPSPWSVKDDGDVVATSNWTGDVILKEFVMVLDTFEDRCSVPAAISNDKLEFKLDSDADVHSKTVESVGCIESESNDAEIPPADVFRIHMRDACEMDDAKKDNMDCTIFNSCCAIFPSSFNLVSCKKIDGSTPFITFDSSYFGRYSGQEILQLFDDLTESKFNRRFLFEIDTDGEINHKLWLTRLEAVINDGRVPLYAIMLARLEQAICDSFKRMLFEREKVLTRPSIEFPFPLLSSKPEALSDDSKVDNFLFSELPSILNDVFNHARAIDNLTLAMDSSTLLSFMEPFTNAFKLTVDDPACCLPRYLASTPLYLILSAARNNNELNFSALNDSVKSSLQRIQDHGSEPKYIQAENDNETIKCFDSNTQSQEDNLDCVKQSCCDDISTEDIENSNSYEDTVEILQQTNHSKSSKRKKKKNKRRKHRKTSSNSHEVEIIEKEDLPNNEELVDDDSPTLGTFGDDVLLDEMQPNVIPENRSFDSVESEVSEKQVFKTVEETNEVHTETVYLATIPNADGHLSSSTTDEVEESESVPTNTTDAPVIDDGDIWETVEVRSKTNRKKTGDRVVGSSRNVQHTTTMNSSSDGNRKPKSMRTPVSRRKNLNRKIVKDILVSVVDSVDNETQKKNVLPQTPIRPVGNPWKIGPPVKAAVPTIKDLTEIVSAVPVKEKTLRDVVLGTHLESPKITKNNLANNTVFQTEQRLPRVDEAIVRDTVKKQPESAVKVVQATRNKTVLSSVADQNTAPTYQETVSAVSTNSTGALGSKENKTSANDKLIKSDSSSGETDDAPQIQLREVIVKSEKDTTPTPPLPTLLSPENANSSTSSVASSLEAPHVVVHNHHHSKSLPNTNDVGYHLLDVCDKLSRDMNLFMSKRAIALDPRRRERGALLAALQDSVSSLWPGRCNVELYGSCAIQLDLPSSDLDVVVVGLDRNVDTMMSQGILSQARGTIASTDSLAANISQDESCNTEETMKLSLQQQLLPMNPYLLMPGHYNGDRVMRLAAELEAQPWAVQVKAIPTASVPVVKILADPSRLAPTSSGRDWIAHSTDVSTQADVVTAGNDAAADSASTDNVSTSVNSFSPPTAYLPWRGSDVVKGLLALDITFEGPEHGGIGSTEFSSRVIAEACQQSGLHPEAAPLVQVLMVLKELLAQRKLNEPYSGGLSSYALLLLVLALQREREVIREEIERVEMQRKAMAVVDSSSSFGNPILNSALGNQYTDPARVEAIYSNAGHLIQDKHVQSTGSSKVENTQQQKFQNGKADFGKKPVKKHQGKSGPISMNSDSAATNRQTSNSWANIAKKASTNKAGVKQNHSTSQNIAKHQQVKKGTKNNQKLSFADAVASSGPVKVATAQQVTSTSSVTRESKVDDTLKVSKADSVVEAASTNGALPYSSQSIPAGIGMVPNETSIPSYIDSIVDVPGFYPQGVNDIIEVLCSGETTAGKLLMHFFLFFGQYFDAQTTAIDISGKHIRESYSEYMSPFIQRRAPGSIDPITGMLIVDPIVIFDPLEGAENNNVARRCFAWNSVRWIFSQSYATLSSAVERSATPPATPNTKASTTNECQKRDTRSAPFNPDVIQDPWDPSSPLLSCLLSF